MSNHHSGYDAIIRAAGLTLRRNCFAFDLDFQRFTLDVRMDEPASLDIHLTYHPRDGREPFAQQREVRTFPRAGSSVTNELKAVMSEMAWNAALAFHQTRPNPPTGWSIHPAAASVIAAASTLLPNPADPLTWLLRSDAELHLPDGGNIVDAVFRGREGVLLLKRASIVDDGGRAVANLRMDGPNMLISLPDPYPETVVDALAGRPADTICDVFAADARGAKVSIKSARNSYGPSPVTVITLADKLVPLLPLDAGRERWRPRTAKTILGPPANAAHKLLAHSPRSITQYYSLPTKTLRKARYAASAAR